METPEIGDIVHMDFGPNGTGLKLHGKVGKIVGLTKPRPPAVDPVYVVEYTPSAQDEDQKPIRYGVFRNEFTVLSKELEPEKLGERAFNELGLIWDELGSNERAVLVTIANRLFVGQKRYGLIEPHKKNWRKEAYEEALDMAVYSACMYHEASDDDS